MVTSTGQRTVSVGTSSTVVSRLQPYASRVIFTLTNTSTAGQKITIAFRQEATSGAGIVLSPGGFYQESRDAGFTPTNDDIFAVSDLAGGSLAVMERVETRLM